MSNLGGIHMNRIAKTGVYTKNGEEYNFNFYTSLRARDKLKFVNFVVNTLIDDNHYNSIIKPLIFDFAIIEIFTDIDTSDIQDSNDSISLIEELLDETNIVEIVKANVDRDLINELNNAVNLNIEYRTGIHRNSLSESLSRLLDTLENKVSEIDTSSMFDMAQVISNMSGELTVDKMLEAYVKSDVFKQRYEQVFADKEKHTVEAETTAVKNVNRRKKSTSTK